MVGPHYQLVVVACAWMVDGSRMGEESSDSGGGWDCSRKVSCNLQDCECSQQNKSGEQLELWLWGLSGHCDTWSF